MLGFSHKDAWGSVEYKAATDALDARTLIMTASIPLNELAIDYDAQRVAQLRADVDTYANKRGIVQVVFRQGAQTSTSTPLILRASLPVPMARLNSAAICVTSPTLTGPSPRAIIIKAAAPAGRRFRGSPF